MEDDVTELLGQYTITSLSSNDWNEAINNTLQRIQWSSTLKKDENQFRQALNSKYRELNPIKNPNELPPQFQDQPHKHKSAEETSSSSPKKKHKTAKVASPETKSFNIYDKKKEIIYQECRITEKILAQVNSTDIEGNYMTCFFLEKREDQPLFMVKDDQFHFILFPVGKKRLRIYKIKPIKKSGKYFISTKNPVKTIDERTKLKSQLDHFSSSLEEPAFSFLSDIQERLSNLIEKQIIYLPAKYPSSISSEEHSPPDDKRVEQEKAIGETDTSDSSVKLYSNEELSESLRTDPGWNLN
jgi:hypothetical protein